MIQGTSPVRWQIASGDSEAAEELARGLSVSPIIAQLLMNRGYDSPEAAGKFMRPSLEDLHDPEDLDGIPQATKRVSQAVSKGEHILIYGDYDVDGMTSTALLHHLFTLMSVRVSHFLPRRIEEGYGLNSQSLRDFSRRGVDLVITVDCGMGSLKEARLARELGMDLIVTDHHEPEGPLPEAVAVVNPKKRGSRYPYRDLAGVGVAFKLAWAVARLFSGRRKVAPEFRDFLLNAVGLVALGTIADVAPLTGENRAFVSEGLNALANTKLPGLRALMNLAGLSERFTSRDVAFRLSPRLNAAGRLNEPAVGLELLTTDSFGRAMEIVRELDVKNRQRQAIERTILASARKKLFEDGNLDARRVVVLADDDWHVGVIGIVASRIAEEFYKPTVLLNVEGDVARGSARSIPPFHMFDALKSCEGILLSYGGHAQAAGIAVEASRVEEFRVCLEAAAESLSDEDLTPMIAVDAEVELSQLTEALVRQLEFLAPFGEGNPQPVFAATGLSLAGKARRVGSDGQHLAFYVRDGRRSMRSIAFGWGYFADELQAHPGTISIVLEPQFNNFRGVEDIQGVVRDIRLD